MDNQSASIVAGVTPAGQPTIFDLKDSGALYEYDLSGWTLLDSGASTITAGVTPGGQPALFDLKPSGVLYMFSAAGWTLLDNAAQTMWTEINPSGAFVLYDVKTNGQIFSPYHRSLVAGRMKSSRCKAVAAFGRMRLQPCECAYSGSVHADLFLLRRFRHRL